MANPQFFSLTSLRGGMNDTDPASSLEDDECVLAENAEFFASPLGERRLGGQSISLVGAAIASESLIAFIAPYLPAGVTVNNSYLFAVGATPSTSTSVSYRSGVTWHDLTPTDALKNTAPEIHRIRAYSIHGKLFVAYKSAATKNRMHVFDGTTLRRTGLDAPAAAPTAAETGAAGTFSGSRIYRVRFIDKPGSTILRRSEPSATLTVTPSGTKTGETVTRPAAISEGETHWELEASSGDGNFYVIATTAIGTTTATDTNNPATAYAAFTLSESAGAYTNIEAAKYVIADQDRVIFGGCWEDNTHGSRIAWTATSNATGYGNDERVPTATNNTIDLDWQDGGDLTGLSEPINGSFYAFKYSRIYKVQRTGNLDRAYESYLMTTTKGAIENSIFNGVDEAGRPCVYFIDPASGPHRVGAAGIQYMANIAGTWATVNTTATSVAAHGVYYPNKLQAHWWLATSNANSPNYKIIAQVSELQSTGGQTRRGWSVANGVIASAYCSAIVPEPVTDPVTLHTALSYRPYIGISGPKILRCDITDDDAGTAYTATILTKPYIIAGLLNRWGAMTAALLARPLDDDTVTLDVSFIRDFGLEQTHINTDFVAEGSESIVNKKFDDLAMSSAYAIQIQFSDPGVVV